MMWPEWLGVGVKTIIIITRALVSQVLKKWFSCLCPSKSRPINDHHEVG